MIWGFGANLTNADAEHVFMYECAEAVNVTLFAIRWQEALCSESRFACFSQM